MSAVVPDDLSFELNQCLRNGVLSLQKDHALACTEPFRIPLAGKVCDGNIVRGVARNRSGCSFNLPLASTAPVYEIQRGIM